jgi:integrase/recombinase XerD
MTSLALDTRPTGHDLDAPTVRLDALAGAFLAGYGSPLTVKAYRSDLRDWFTFAQGHDFDPLEARRPHIDLYARSMEDAGKRPATVARRLSTLARFYDYAVTEGVLEASPVAHVQRPKVTNAPNLGPERDDLRRLLDTAKASGPRDHALVCLLGVMGLRVAEACGATPADLASERGHRTLRIIRKGGKAQTVPLPTLVADAVDACLDGRTSGTILGTNRAGKPFGRDDAARALRRLCRAAGIAPVSPHALRHGAATQMLALGLPLHRVQDALGHADPRTTRRYDDARHALDGHAAYAFASDLDTDHKPAQAGGTPSSAGAGRVRFLTSLSQ